MKAIMIIDLLLSISSLSDNSFFMWNVNTLSTYFHLRVSLQQPGLQFGLFWNCLSEMKWFSCLAIFGSFMNFKAFFWRNLIKLYSVLKIVRIVVANLRWQLIWPFFKFENLPKFETPHGQNWPLPFFWPGNPKTQTPFD